MSKILIQKAFLFLTSVFKSEPPLPPSSAQAVQKEAETSENFLMSIKSLLMNKGYLLLLLSYAINVGIFYAISTLLSQIIVKYHPVSTIDEPELVEKKKQQQID